MLEFLCTLISLLYLPFLLVMNYADHYDRLSQCYDQFYDNETAAKEIIKYLDLQPEDRLVDVGGGTGAMAEVIHKKVGKSWKGIDFSLP